MTKCAPLAAALAVVVFGASARAEGAGGDVTVTDTAKPQNGGDVRVTDLSATSSATNSTYDTSVTYLTPGFLLSLVGGPTDATGLGGEVSLMHYRSANLPSFGLGGVAQVQVYDGKWLRVGLAAQAAYGPLGVELGLALRQGNDLDATTLSLQAAEFLSIGYVSIGIRESPALIAFPTDLPSFGFETALTLAFKVPVAVAGFERTRLVPDVTGATMY